MSIVSASATSAATSRAGWRAATTGDDRTAASSPSTSMTSTSARSPPTRRRRRVERRPRRRSRRPPGAGAPGAARRPGPRPGWQRRLVDEDPAAVEAGKDVPGRRRRSRAPVTPSRTTSSGSSSRSVPSSSESGRALRARTGRSGRTACRADGVGDDDVDVRGPAQVELDARSARRGGRPRRRRRSRRTASRSSSLEPLGRQADVGAHRLAHRVLQSGPHGGGHHGREGDHGHADDQGQRGREAQGGVAYGAGRTEHGDRRRGETAAAVAASRAARGRRAARTTQTAVASSAGAADDQRVDADGAARLDDAATVQREQGRAASADDTDLEHPADLAPGAAPGGPGAARAALRALVSSPHRTGTRSAVTTGRARPQRTDVRRHQRRHGARRPAADTGRRAAAPRAPWRRAPARRRRPRADASASAGRRRARSVCTPSAKTATSTPARPERARASSAYVEAIRSLVCSTTSASPVAQVEPNLRQAARTACSPAGGPGAAARRRPRRSPAPASSGNHAVSDPLAISASRARPEPGSIEDRAGDRGPDPGLLLHRRGHQVAGVRLVPAVGVDDVDDRRHRQGCRVLGSRSPTWRSSAVGQRAGDRDTDRAVAVVGRRQLAVDDGDDPLPGEVDGQPEVERSAAGCRAASRCSRWTSPASAGRRPVPAEAAAALRRTLRMAMSV